MPVGTFGKIELHEIAPGRVRARARYRDYDGTIRPVSKYGPTKSKAEYALKEALRDRITPTGGDITPETTMRNVIAQWLDNVNGDESLSPNTRDLYDRTAAQVLAGLGALRLREVGVPAVDRFLAATIKTHGPGTAKTARTVLSGALGLAVRHGALPTNPVREADRIKRPTRKEPARALTPDELTDLLAKVRADKRAAALDLPDLIETMAGTGCRIGEALALRRACLKAGTIEVNATVVRVKGQGLIVQERTKTDAGWRVIALPAHLAELLTRRSDDEWTPNDFDLILPTALGNIRDPRNTARDLRDLFGRVGYPWVHGHTFRKTVATMLDDAGLSARVIADHLGHAHPSMTQDTYLGRRVVSAAAAEALER